LNPELFSIATQHHQRRQTFQSESNTLLLPFLVISEVGYRVSPGGDGNEQTGANYPHIQSSKNGSSNQEEGSAVALGVGVQETVSSTTDATPVAVGGLIFQPGPMPEMNGSNLGRGK